MKQLIINVKSRYAAEDEAIIGLICRTASERYSKDAGILKKNGVLIEFMDSRDKKIHISDTEDISDRLDLLFSFADGNRHDKRLVIINHTLAEYEEIIKKETRSSDIILIKNYIPSYRSERTLFGPNELKSFFGRGIKVFALELDVRIQNRVYMGIMEGHESGKRRYDGRRGMGRQLAAICRELMKESGMT